MLIRISFSNTLINGVYDEKHQDMESISIVFFDLIGFASYLQFVKNFVKLNILKDTRFTRGSEPQHQPQDRKLHVIILLILRDLSVALPSNQSYFLGLPLNIGQNSYKTVDTLVCFYALHMKQTFVPLCK